MGRWGHCMFEGDQDADISHEINQAVMGDDESQPVFLWAFYFRRGKRGDFPKMDLSVYREKFDSGIADKLFAEYRAKESFRDAYSYRYRIIVLAAKMMHVGAKLKPELIQYIREILPKIPSREGRQWIVDDGFRGPGHRQFLASLDNYKSGTPRSFDQLSCHGCGKVASDIGRPLLRCAGCTIAHGWYCDKECQKKDRKAHKKSCGTQDPFSLNI
ncbi:putative mynd finger [Podospora aff. communis PSN243]|uniref:Mynd finger n=1 Tax=Podospora aff. communis PSN243 TaxID=3040156 RepID=A0AAV9G2L2_9PEZI|nr:putative mynd finger [Podospora aff. communis PSN243]